MTYVPEYTSLITIHHDLYILHHVRHVCLNIFCISLNTMTYLPEHILYTCITKHHDMST